MSFGQWQPIDTAPKDGSAVLGFGSFFTGVPPYINIIRWQESAAKDEYEPIGDGNYRKVTKVVAGWCAASGPVFNAVNWMPLPDPPAAESAPSNFVASEAKL